MKPLAEATPDQTLPAAVLLALERGEAVEARRLAEEALMADPASAAKEEWAQLRDVAGWPDAWLVAAVRQDPPDAEALDALVDRYWKPLFGRCQMLTLDSQRASDLAQEAWCRVLRARHSLKPDGNFPAYLATIATNLWRDSIRFTRRAGPMAPDRLASLDAELAGDEGGRVTLVEVLPDLNTLQAEERALLKLDIDQALGQLSPLLREVLVARYISGESCAEMGRRYGRTEQTISAWVRDAIKQMRLHFERSAHGAAPEIESSA
jgi:RNA polymerase sigma-70 factor (ECF subfamily)